MKHDTQLSSFPHKTWRWPIFEGIPLHISPYFRSLRLNHLHLSIPLCTIKLIICAQHLTWINSWRQITPLLAIVRFLKQSTVVLFALALSSDIVNNPGIPHSSKHCQYSFLIFPTRINEMSSDAHVIHILNRSPCVSGQTNHLTSFQKLGLHCFLSLHIQLDTIPHQCIARRKPKLRLKNLE
jgi:hypothetical protein